MDVPSSGQHRGGSHAVGGEENSLDEDAQGAADALDSGQQQTAAHTGAQPALERNSSMPFGVFGRLKQSVYGGDAGIEQSGEKMQKNMFADAEALRAQLHENLGNKDYDVMDYYHEAGVFQMVAKNPRFNNLTLLIISINAGWMGFDAECNDQAADGHISNCPVQPTDTWFWNAGEQLFCCFFTLELVVRFGAFKKKMSALRDHWFKFDSVLVAFMVAETWVMPLLGGGNALGDVSLLRMLRLLRLTRMVRLMRSVPELVTLLKGMAIASRSVGYTLLLLLIIMYIFSIIFTQQLAATENVKLQSAFSGIFICMWSIMLSGCLLDESHSLATELLEESVFLAALFIGFVLCASLMVLNMLIGVLCAVVTAVAAAEKEKILVGLVKSKLMSVLETLDEDGNGTISKEEFDELINIPEATQALDELGVDIQNLASLADHLFEGEENDHGGRHSQHKADEPVKEGSMTFADFLEMVIRLRAENTPCVADIVELRKLVHKSQKSMQRKVNQLEKGQLAIQRGIRMVSEQLDSSLSLWEEMSVTMHGSAASVAPKLAPAGQKLSLASSVVSVAVVAGSSQNPQEPAAA
eukprot:TRINITY_DN102243_c0_g1_i1.p1 TRINITY_DN102243_c0_g1~~TRINITY_DN102243_c0_g1_i1.p1  ORF type:complete len:583 (+),score=120.11 TRINITY_DN102243_c0_g1_i1:63-1811(+)